MARYSSDSDSDRSNRHRRKHYRRSRSSSSDSSDSSSYKKRSSKHSKSRRHRRSRSKSRDRDKASKSSGYKSTRGNSRDRDKRRYRSKKSKSLSPDRGKRKGRSPSREKSTSRSSSAQSSVKPINDKTLGAFSKDEFSIEPRIKESVLEEINSESFTPKQFTSSASGKDSKFRNVVIDVSAETIQAPAVKTPSEAVESIFHTSIMMDHDVRFDKWVKKLYTLRQKAISDVTHMTIT